MYLKFLIDCRFYSMLVQYSIVHNLTSEETENILNETATMARTNPPPVSMSGLIDLEKLNISKTKF